LVTRKIRIRVGERRRTKTGNLIFFDRRGGMQPVINKKEKKKEKVFVLRITGAEWRKKGV